ncbi:hypothetical protein NPIL_305781 [Nephila pilipes]|uniref:Uncharacterized protein n=1 Tax=Nephila pilipes TaxID=299642 RepID=A0A8X6QC09_NEPPI|nr:hypothetical protein NPIL_305781 [Nephila pilipes]
MSIHRRYSRRGMRRAAVDDATMSHSGCRRYCAITVLLARRFRSIVICFTMTLMPASVRDSHAEMPAAAACRFFRDYFDTDAAVTYEPCRRHTP